MKIKRTNICIKQVAKIVFRQKKFCVITFQRDYKNNFTSTSMRTTQKYKLQTKHLFVKDKRKNTFQRFLNPTLLPKSFADLATSELFEVPNLGFPVYFYLFLLLLWCCYFFDTMVDFVEMMAEQRVDCEK